jgi:hypothetical protein
MQLKSRSTVWILDVCLTNREMTNMSERDSKTPSAKDVNRKTSPKVVQTAVAGRLKAYYDEIANQQVPDRLIELLNKLDEPGK